MNGLILLDGSLTRGASNAGNQMRGFAEDGTALKFDYDAANRLQVITRVSDNAFLHGFQFGSTNARLTDTDFTTGYTRMFASVGGTYWLNIRRIGKHLSNG